MELTNAEEINVAVGNIERAELKPIYNNSGEEIKNWKRVEVAGKDVAIVSKQYKLVQHEEAFRPVIEGLTIQGVSDFKFSLWTNHKRAWMNVFVGEGFDTVKYGFRITNSVDKSTSVRYGLSAFTETRTLELVGYRLACSNGMLVRVNLDDAEIVKVEERIKIDNLLQRKVVFKHIGNVSKKLQEVQYLVEAFTLLKNPLERIIKKARDRKLTLKQAKDFIELYIGKRKQSKILLQYAKEEQNLWGLYNATTYLVSHKDSIKATRLNTALTRASIMLEEEIKVVV